MARSLERTLARIAQECGWGAEGVSLAQVVLLCLLNKIGTRLAGFRSNSSSPQWGALFGFVWRRCHLFNKFGHFHSADTNTKH